MSDEKTKHWWWQDHNGWHGPNDEESARVANEKFGIGRPITHTFSADQVPSYIRVQYEYEVHIGPDQFIWVARDDEAHAIKSVEEFAAATGNIRARTLITTTSAWKVVAVNKNSGDTPGQNGVSPT